MQRAESSSGGISRTDGKQSTSSARADICYLTNQLEPAGAPNVVLDLVQNTDERIDFTICFFGSDDTLQTEFEAAGAQVVDFGAQTDHPQFDPRSIVPMVQFFRRNSFDILHCHLPYSQSLGRIVGALSDVEHVVSTQHNVRSNYFLVERGVEQVTRPLDSATVAVSDGVRESFESGERGPFASSDRWQTIHNGLDVESFRRNLSEADPDAVREKLDLDDERIYVSVGRYVSVKAQADLIRAMAAGVPNLENAHLLIVGWGPLESALKETATELGVSDRVTVTGFADNVYDYYAVADAFVSSSTKEGLPIAQLEAMAAELPIVATAIPGVEEVITDGETGLLVPPESPDALASAMGDLASAKRRSALGTRALKRVRNEFTIQQMVRDHLALYGDLLGKDLAVDPGTA